jgi:hypothetical protein
MTLFSMAFLHDFGHDNRTRHKPGQAEFFSSPSGGRSRVPRAFDHASARCSPPCYYCNPPPMPFPVTRLEKRILSVLALLIALGLIGMAMM